VKESSKLEKLALAKLLQVLAPQLGLHNYRTLVNSYPLWFSRRGFWFLSTFSCPTNYI
jgi:hypothetical protein